MFWKSANGHIRKSKHEYWIEIDSRMNDIALYICQTAALSWSFVCFCLQGLNRFLGNTVVGLSDLLLRLFTFGVLVFKGDECADVFWMEAYPVLKPAYTFQHWRASCWFHIRHWSTSMPSVMQVFELNTDKKPGWSLASLLWGHSICGFHFTQIHFKWALV